MVYSADSDRFEKITWAAVKDKMVNGETGRNSTDSSNGTAALDALSTEDKAAKKGAILFRPFQTYRMASAILAKGGSELGSTYHGHHDFMLSDDILRKVHVGHYTFYSKSVVKRPKNYIIIEDIFSQGYVGGEGIEVYSKDEFAEDMADGQLGKGGRPSIIAVSSYEPKHDVLDITGRFHQTVYDIFSDNGSSTEHYHGSGKAYSALGLTMIEPYRHNIADEYIQRVQRFNTVCFRGMQYTLMADDGSPVTTKDAKGTIKLTQLNTGHWGTNVYPGVRKVREGENSFMKQCDYNLDRF